MKISCGIAEDILPLFVDGSCSFESKAAVEEHLGECPTCREKYERMKMPGYFSGGDAGANDRTAVMAAYAKKVRRHRLVLRILIPAAVIILAFFLSVLGRAVSILQCQRTSEVTDVEAGTHNLTVSDLVCGIKEAEGFSFFTNSTQIVVTIKSESDFEGIVVLRKADQDDERIMLARVSSARPVCVFTNLTSESRYGISLEGVPSGNVEVSGSVGFWQAVSMVLDDLL
ncbi:MAG: zf-HC2 domain-containing protein [Lachnospiraceae bacterium]|nr:zf-HC2 domain-containing protein [Lachnospiraceae bacterium]